MQTSNRLSRRHFLQAVGVAAGTSALAACVPAAPAATTANSSAAATGTATRGVLRMSHTLEWNGKESLAPMSPVRFFPPVSLLYNRLVRHSSEGRPEPDLAESWEADETAQIWTFNLRQGIQFHDGKPLTAKDVVYTLQYVVDPELGSPGASVLEIIDSTAFETPDEYTVVFKLKQPHADFPLLLLHYSCYIIPEGSRETIHTTGIGTGPFKLETLNVEGKTVLAANDDYWEGAPGLAKIEVLPIADAEARTAALLADQIDMDDISYSAVDLVRRNENYVINSIPAGGWNVLVMRTDTAPFDDLRVRQAMKLVVDRAVILQTALQDFGAIAADQPVWPGDQYHLSIDRPRDVEQAKALLAEAGYADGLEVTLFTSTISEGMIEMAIAYKEMAAEAGINVEIKQTPAEGYWNEVWMTEAFCSSSWGERQADQVLNEVYRSGASWNETYWSNPTFDQLLDDARKELDFEKRKALYQQAQQLLSDEGGAIIPAFAYSVSAAHKRVQGVDMRFIRWNQVTITA
ncbi:MAG: ABC transporter substrate-binding protein [Caldilineaceae bacterium]